MDARVLLLHRERLFAQALTERLLEDGLVAQWASPAKDVEITHAVRVFQPDLIVMAMGSTTYDEELLPSEVRALQFTPWLAIVARGSTREAIRAIDAGALGFMTTQSTLEDLAAAIRRGLTGEELQTRAELDLMRRKLELADRRRQERLGGLMSLSPREAEILSDLAEGYSPEVIARARTITVSTVRTHVKRIHAKLAVSSQLEAVAHARRSGWRHPRVVDEDPH